jgi:lipopolysaccharide export system protein LptC
MKHSSGQLFSIALLATVAGLTFMLQAALVPDAAKPDRRLTHDPDAIAENFEIRRLDDQGKLKYRLKAPYIIHYPDDDSSEVKTPRLIAYRQDAPPLILTAERAKITARGEMVYLNENVKILRESTAQSPALLASTSILTVEPDAGLAYTDQAIEITQGASWIKGVGARINSNASTFELQSRVRGHHVASRVQP